MSMTSQPKSDFMAGRRAACKAEGTVGADSTGQGVKSRMHIRRKAGDLCYYVMSRTAGGAFLFDDEAKEAFRLMLWRMATFIGVQVLTYCVMDSHFHVLVRVPNKAK